MQSQRPGDDMMQMAASASCLIWLQLTSTSCPCCRACPSCIYCNARARHWCICSMAYFRLSKMRPANSLLQLTTEGDI